MADIKISELGSAAVVNDTDVIPMTASGVTVKAPALVLKNYMGVGALSGLATDDKTSLVNAVNEVDSHTDIVQAQVSNSDDEYEPTRPYKVGELCIYNNELYRCTTACSAGSWATNQSCFTEDTLTGVVNDLNSGLTGKIIERTFTDTTSAGANITITVPTGYRVLGVFCDSIALRYALYQRFQGTDIVHVVDSNMSPLANTLTEVHVMMAKIN